jgi:hypothetical protein
MFSVFTEKGHTTANIIYRLKGKLMATMLAGALVSHRKFFGGTWIQLQQVGHIYSGSTAASQIIICCWDGARERGRQIMCVKQRRERM